MIIVWNVRGAAGKAFGQTLIDMKKRTKAKIFVLVETRCSGPNAQKVIKQLGFKYQIVEEARGLSGGIWILWNDDLISLTVLSKHKQYIHCAVTGIGRRAWLFTAIYASPRATEREELWNDLIRIADSINMPWLIAGDFNDIKSPDEQKGGVAAHERKCKKFRDNIARCKLIDMGTEGPRYTWKGPRCQFSTHLYKKLDRGLCNLEWRNEFNEAFIRVGPRIQSDHHPLLIHIEHAKRGVTRRPFRFEAVWLQHSEFKNFLHRNWSTQGNIKAELGVLEPKLIRWNEDVFGHIRQKKNKLMRRIEGIQRATQINDNSFLQQLEFELRNELAEVLNQEEILWFQKSRTKWLNDGDRNTTYYHTKTTIRRRQNRVRALKDRNGDWVEEEAEVESMVNDFYKTLFQEEQVDRPWASTHHSWPEITQDEWAMLGKEVSNEEIKQAMFSIGGLKAPGRDGYPAIFFQKNWEIVREEVRKAIKDMWTMPDKIQELNQTLITLIPKVDSPEKVNQFRPISLCNVVYKCFSKIIVQRLKTTLVKIISPFQVSFIPGRNIHDNVIIVNELIHTMKKKRGKTGFMAIKVDLEKAYDRVSWGYMEKLLEEINCPSTMSSRIMNCIKSSCTNILWHGDKLMDFTTSRGLRQGDPISPYLFVLGMEKLTHMILDRVREKKWKGMRAGRRGPIISHMMFADDLVLFAEANQKQIGVILNCLQVFGDMSGHKLSQEKTSIFFSPNVPLRERREICASSGFKEVAELGRYLGANIATPRKRRDKYSFVVEKMKGRLNGWKAASLSLAGRITLVKSASSSMAYYPMQHDRLPLGVVEEIEREQRKFIWGEKEGERKRHAIAWNQLCQPKEEGGLGIKRLKDMNDAFLTKLLWKMEVEPDTLWVKVLKSKYDRNSGTTRELIAKGSDSRLWKELTKLWEDFNKNTCNSVTRTGEQQLIWLPGGRGVHSVASHYKWLCKSNGIQKHRKWKQVWKLQIPERVRVFFWMTLHQRLPTKKVTARWSNEEGWCEICCQNIEDQLHALRDCPASHELWKHLVPRCSWHEFFAAEEKNWLITNLLNYDSITDENDWPEIFALGCWTAWLWRNKQLHDPNFQIPRQSQGVVREMLKHYRQKWGGESLNPPPQEIADVKWQIPPRGWVKVNVDGSFIREGIGGCGGVVRGHAGEWIKGFSIKLEEPIQIATEVAAVLEGLKLCWDLQLRKVIVESDDKEVVEAIQGKRQICACKDLWEQICELSNRDWNVTFDHVLRESNECANKLAAVSIKQREKCRHWNQPPKSVESMLFRDVMGYGTARRIVN